MKQQLQKEQSRLSISPALMRELIVIQEGMEATLLSRKEPPNESWYRYQAVKMIIRIIKDLCYGTDKTDKELRETFLEQILDDSGQYTQIEETD